ncbi:MAG: amidohydrolase [Ruminococcaceae bacterium]|nr:amidohydrolase [Oscillospiraceae bacterium]
MYRDIIEAELTQWRSRIEKLAMDIWENPEGANAEYKACRWTAELLRDAGFTVEVGVAGLATAIRASYGSGKPVYGLLGEYDALPGLSQKVSAVREPVEPGGMGHGCSHNLLGAAHVGAAIAMKKLIELGKISGTVVFFGCPGEEEHRGKGLMAREHLFDDVDFNISFHPYSRNTVSYGTSAALRGFRLHFKGRSAHAGTMPHQGRSALDAVELTNVGINYLREHVPTTVRMHYVITQGGTAPNIVPDSASGWYYVRAATVKTLNEVYERMLDVARGAALMTHTELQIEDQGGCYPTMPNHTLCDVLYEILQTEPQEPWTEEELAFAEALNDDPELTNHLFPGGVTPKTFGSSGGSSDVGDVQHVSPGVFFYTACRNTACVGHSWQATACSGHSIGLKGMLYAAKIMAIFGSRVMSDPALLETAKAEFRQKVAKEPFVCLYPSDYQVTTAEN